jgi:hypothetical protein
MQAQFCDAAVEKSAVLHCNSTYSHKIALARLQFQQTQKARIQILGLLFRRELVVFFSSLHKFRIKFG